MLMSEGALLNVTTTFTNTMSQTTKIRLT